MPIDRVGGVTTDTKQAHREFVCQGFTPQHYADSARRNAPLTVTAPCMMTGAPTCGTAKGRRRPGTHIGRRATGSG